MLPRLTLLTLLLSAVVTAQPQPDLPRFRAGTNLVRVDAYVSKDDTPVVDLTVDDFEVYEDDAIQKVENFELIRAREAVPGSLPANANNTRDMRQQARDAARVFTLFFDPMYVSLSGSYYLQKPLVETLNKVIGPDDLIGAMVPELSPSSITYSKRPDSIEQFVKQHWAWGARDRKGPLTAQEDAIGACYDPDDPKQRGLAGEMIRRLREGKTLDALQSLVTHLEGLRPERKFVIVFTEGWALLRPDASLSRNIDAPLTTPEPITVDPANGRIRPEGSTDPATGRVLSKNACERLRMQLSQVDHEREFMTLLQRANRANVSFYPVDARGLLVFDQPTNFDILPSQDQAILRNRHGHLQDMAGATDGYAVLNTGHVAAGLTKIFRDVGSYYLLSYYSSNQKLDGRFRRIQVKVKRSGADVRARMGYLAPTEAEARAASALVDKATASALAPTVSRALDSLVPTRGNLPVRIQAAGGAGSIGAVVELDAVTLKQPEWVSGGTLRVSFAPESASNEGNTVTVAVEPGQRSIEVAGPESLGAGKYVVRAELTPRGTRSPLQVSTSAEVSAADATVGTAALAYRRGPATGLAYVPTADARFRRTERLRIEVPLSGAEVTMSGRMLTREGQPMPLTVTTQVRRDEARKRSFGQGEVVLSPLAAGEYVLELTFTMNGTTVPIAYGFRIVP